MFGDLQARLVPGTGTGNTPGGNSDAVGDHPVVIDSRRIGQRRNGNPAEVACKLPLKDDNRDQAHAVAGQKRPDRRAQTVVARTGMQVAQVAACHLHGASAARKEGEKRQWKKRGGSPGVHRCEVYREFRRVPGKMAT